MKSAANTPHAYHPPDETDGTDMTDDAEDAGAAATTPWISVLLGYCNIGENIGPQNQGEQAEVRCNRNL